MLDRHFILGVHITDRLEEAVEVQKLLTAFGHMIKTRLGLHEIEKGADDPNGVLLLEMVGDDETINDFAGKLDALKGVEVQKMIFHHG